MSLTHVIISDDRKSLRRVRYMEAPNVTTSRAKPLELPQTLSASPTLLAHPHASLPAALETRLSPRVKREPLPASDIEFDMTSTRENPSSQAVLGEMRPRERRWNNRGRGRRSSRITGTMIIAACCSRVPGALAAAFADRTALKTAVDNCLLAVGTGENCCSSEMADCGAAGNVDMPN